MNAVCRISGFIAALVVPLLLFSSCRKPATETAASLQPATESEDQVLAQVIRTNVLSKEDLARIAQRARSSDQLTFSGLTKEQAYQLLKLTIEHLSEGENKEGDAHDLLSFLQGNCSSESRTQWRAWLAGKRPDEISWSIALRTEKRG